MRYTLFCEKAWGDLKKREDSFLVGWLINVAGCEQQQYVRQQILHVGYKYQRVLVLYFSNTPCKQKAFISLSF